MIPLAQELNTGTQQIQPILFAQSVILNVCYAPGRQKRNAPNVSKGFTSAEQHVKNVTVNAQPAKDKRQPSARNAVLTIF